MPALPSVASVVRVALQGEMSSATPWVTRHYIKYASAAPTAAQLNTFCTAVGTAWNANLASVSNVTCALQTVAAEDLTSPTGATGFAATPHSGSLAGGNLPAQVAMVIGYPIARRYRGGHPRGYWPMGDETKVNNDQTWTAAFLASVQTQIDAYFTAVLAAGWTGAGALSLVNVSYYSGFTVVISPTTGRAHNRPTLRGTPVVDAILSHAPRANFGTQRRRV